MPRVAVRLYALVSAIAFVSSLGYFVYVYGMRLGPGRMTPASMGTGLVTNVGLFTLFALHHSLLARTGAKRWIERRLPPSLERSTYVLVASALFGLTCACWQQLPGALYHGAGVVGWIGLSAQASGIVMTLWGASVLDPLELAGVRQAAAPAPDAHAPPALRIRGPYRWVRHPIYSGWVLLVFGTPEMTFGRLSFAVVSTAYIVVAMPWEERSMVEVFGEEYQRYVAAVRWRMIPWLY